MPKPTAILAMQIVRDPQILQLQSIRTSEYA